MSIDQNPAPQASSVELAGCLLASATSPSQAILRAERELYLQQALEQMDAIDREVLVLRHFEQLSNPETAQVLGISRGAASQRYGRALKRLKDILNDLPGGV